MPVSLRILYSFAVYPLLLILVHIYSIFDHKARSAVLARYKVLSRAKKWTDRKRKLVMVHAASMGEFEHIKPLILGLSGLKDVSIIVSFFSPSGYENVKNFPGVDLFLYTTFDFKTCWTKLYMLLKPDMFVISKHDVWPNQILAAKMTGKPIFLVNATLSETSTRVRGLTKYFLKYIYRTFDTIYAVSEQDRAAFSKYFPRTRVKMMGDTKFDQVLLRKKEISKKTLIDKEWTEDSFVMILGSIWKEDNEILFPVLKKQLESMAKLKIIIAPHELNKEFVDNIISYFGSQHSCLYSEIQEKCNRPVIVVDKIGILADLYGYADLAFVGGGYKQGVHNVMEPAVYQIPVMYGPVHQISYEATKLPEAGGSIIIETTAHFKDHLTKLIDSPELRRSIGNKAYQYAIDNLNTTDKLINEWTNILNAK